MMHYVVDFTTIASNSSNVTLSISCGLLKRDRGTDDDGCELPDSFEPLSGLFEVTVSRSKWFRFRNKVKPWLSNGYQLSSVKKLMTCNQWTVEVELPLNPQFKDTDSFREAALVQKALNGIFEYGIDQFLDVPSQDWIFSHIAFRD